MQARIWTLAVAMLASSAHAEDVFGVWKSQPSEAGAYIHVEIARCPADRSTICGDIIGVFNNDDDLPPDPGRMMIEKMSPSGDREWGGGTIWAPDEDKVYAAKMALRGKVLHVSGCIFGGLVCRGQDWSRVK